MSQNKEREKSGNLLLDSLSDIVFGQLMCRAVRVPAPVREIVAEPGRVAEAAHFPLTCVLSAIIPLRDGSAIEAATIGNEGMSGIDLPVERGTSLYRMIVQVPGERLQIPAEDFRAVLAEHGAFAEMIKRYTLTVVHQASQTATCNLRHSVEERMCRWLLMTHDRVRSDEFFLTQEFLGIMLGVRRQSVSLVAATLQEAGLLRYTRGNVNILNRPGLEGTACECYEAVQKTYEQVMGIRPNYAGSHKQI